MSTPRPHVVIAGGGIAGVEALLALRELAGARCSVEVIAPDPDLVLRPLAVAAPFGTADVRRHPLADICADQDAHLRRDAVTFVDVARRRVETARGGFVPYDALVLAVGARAHDVLPGALTFDGPGAVEPYRELLESIGTGRVRSVAFAVPGGVTWSLPLYELALMTADAFAGLGLRSAFVTPERSPLAAFGAEAGRLIERLFAERDIALHVRSTPLRFTNGFLMASEGAVRADRVVALPELEGTRIAGVPCDAHGFVAVDEHGRVTGAPGVYAAGDGTAVPVKQGGVASQLADAAAEHIAASLGAPCSPEPFEPVLRAELLTGALPWFLRRGETSRSPLWWPAGKVAARYLAPYLAGEEALEDRSAHAVDEEELEAARDMALILSDDAAASGERARALLWLDAAEGAGGTLPREYVAKRRRWRSGDADRPLVRSLGGSWE